MKTNDLLRALLHFPVGLLAGLITALMPISGFIFAMGFMFYEFIEDWRIADHSYKDVFGFLAGYALGTIGFIWWRLK